MWEQLVRFGYKPPIEIPDDWWCDAEARRFFGRRGYRSPDFYSAEGTASESDEDAIQDEQHLSAEDEAFACGEASGGAILSLASSPDAILSTPSVAPAHPTTIPAAGVDNGQIGQANVVAGHQRRGFRGFLKGFSCL